MKIQTLKKGTVNNFLKRLKNPGTDITGPDLDDVLKEILFKANEFVPSKAGSILLDDPLLKSAAPEDPTINKLHYVACFGPGCGKMLGAKIPVTAGAPGRSYLTGKPYVSRGTKKDLELIRETDAELGRSVKSVLCVPIVIGESICGVIELVDRAKRGNYTKHDLKLLEIFAGYTSTLMQNALDAKRNLDLTKQDSLTGLFNDRYFHSQLTTELKKAKRAKKDISLLFIDLDNFKRINDTHGHLVGSRTLAEVGVLLRDTLEGQNARIVRYGGDEFAVILPGKDKKKAAAVAVKVCAAVKEGVFLKEKGPSGQHPLNIKGIISCSIGISSFFEDGLAGESIEEEKIMFIRKADQAMYKAKEQGKDRIWLA